MLRWYCALTFLVPPGYLMKNKRNGTISQSARWGKKMPVAAAEDGRVAVQMQVMS